MLEAQKLLAAPAVNAESLLDCHVLLSERAMEARARRAARAAGYAAIKSRRAVGSIDNYGHFMIIAPHTNFVVCGLRFDMTAEEVIEWCAE